LYFKVAQRTGRAHPVRKGGRDEVGISSVTSSKESRTGSRAWHRAGPFRTPARTYLISEAGEGQAKQVMRLLDRSGAYEAIEVVEQHDGLAVVVMAQRKAPPQAAPQSE
ncbi:MAG TPA: hypothetical protein VF331_09945, partial [Polyangiales bacterium]